MGSKVGWSKALDKTVDYRVDSQAKVGMRERGFKEEGIREEMETEGAKGQRARGTSRTRALDKTESCGGASPSPWNEGRGTSWSAVGRGASWHKAGSMVGRTRGREMGRAPWLEQFASRWAARWVESQLPSWLGAALRQTFIGFQLRFMLHRASADDTSMTCCSCTPCGGTKVHATH